MTMESKLRIAVNLKGNIDKIIKKCYYCICYRNKLKGFMLFVVKFLFSNVLYIICDIIIVKICFGGFYEKKFICVGYFGYYACRFFCQL